VLGISVRKVQYRLKEYAGDASAARHGEEDETTPEPH
jgi:hypothetical protein